MKELIHEIHRRSLWQVLGIYVAASWIVLQVVDVIGNNFGLPEWVPPAALILLLIGLPIVLATAVVQEGVSTRPAKTQEASPDDDALARLPPVQEPEVRGHHRLFTWRIALLGGGVAFALLGVVTAGYMAMRTLGIGPAGTLVAKGVLEEREELVLADFESSSDTLLARTVAEALRRALAESSILRFVDESRISETLRRMERDPTFTPIDRDVAREIARRQGLKGFVTGVVNRAGAGYLLSADLVLAELGETVITAQESARDDDGVIDAIDRLSRTFRERAGESLRAVKAAPPLSRYTTSSLPALQAYVQGSGAEAHGERDRAIRLLEEAVALDTTFAMAHRRLGVVYGLAGVRSRSVASLSSALRHSDRLTEQERSRIRAMYHLSVSGDFEAGIAEYLRERELDPDSLGSPDNLANALELAGRLEEAERVLDDYFTRVREMRGGSPSNWVSHQLRIRQKYALGKREEALAALEAARAVNPDSRRWDTNLIYLAIADGDYDAADSLATAIEAKYGGTLWSAQLAWLHGRLREADTHFQRVRDDELDRGFEEGYLNWSVPLALVRLARGDPEGGVRALEEALERVPMDSLPALDRPYFSFAAAYARLGKADEARRWIQEWEAEVDPRLGDPQGIGPLFPKAWLALEEGRPDEAVALFRGLHEQKPMWTHEAFEPQRICTICLYYEIGRAYDRAGVADSAIVLYERFLATPLLYRWHQDAPERARILERLGQLHDERGDPERAANYYAQFVELWAEADPELQPRVQATQARLEEILRERG